MIHVESEVPEGEVFVGLLGGGGLELTSDEVQSFVQHLDEARSILIPDGSNRGGRGFVESDLVGKIDLIRRTQSI